MPNLIRDKIEPNEHVVCITAISGKEITVYRLVGCFAITEDSIIIAKFSDYRNVEKFLDKLSNQREG